MDNTESRAEVQLSVIGSVHELLASSRISHWLAGGWAVDFTLGDVMRDHADIDFVVWRRDLDAIVALLRRRGLGDPGPQHTDSGISFIWRGERVDLDLIERDGSGDIVSRRGRFEQIWPPSALQAPPARLDGSIVPVLGAEALLDAKVNFRDGEGDGTGGPSLRGKDLVDVSRLRAFIGGAVPRGAMHPRGITHLRTRT